jgi:hypothetical protein
MRLEALPRPSSTEVWHPLKTSHANRGSAAAGAKEGNGMSATNRTCTCGAVYSRTESLAASREMESFECSACGATMESWNSAWVPRYRLIVGPVRKPDAG